jgi:thioredoxin-dependent peroxiredoxin
MSFPEVGSKAPDFEVTTESGKPVKLSDFHGKKIVLYFYPKADTPGCTTQACTFRDNYAAFAERDVVVLGASPDTVDAQKAFKEKYKLPFTLLADAAHTVADAYGVWGNHTVTLGDKDFDYTGVRRSTLVIGPDGTVLDARWGVDPANDSEAVLAILDENGA